MKKLSIIFILFIMLSACNKDDDSVEKTTNNLTDNQWKIDYFWDNSQDETSDFQGYIFEFNSNGEVTAYFNTSSKEGSYTIKKSDDDDHSEVTFNFGSGDPLEELNNSWHITGETDSKIEMKDENGSGDAEVLVLSTI